MIVNSAANGLEHDPRRRMLARKAALWNERSSCDAIWMEISKHQQPYLGRFFVTDRNSGSRRNNIIDNTGLIGSRTLAAGMMSGMTSPARPWFKTTLEDTDLREYAPVKTWLHRLNSMMLQVFAASNTYQALQSCYEEIGLFGTWANFVMDNFDTVIHHYPMTVGEYAIGTDEMGRVNTICREMQMTVGQIVRKFGLENCSTTIKNMYDRRQIDAWVDVIHMVEPRDDRDSSKRDARNMPFASTYFEPGADNWEKFLRESGFERFPALCPRWSVTSNNIYGDSPGMLVLGDVKQLQHQHLRKGQAIDYQANPPILLPSALKAQASAGRLPGGVLYSDNPNRDAIRSAFEVNLNLQHLREDIQDVRQRIKTGYYEDLFLMLANDTRSGITAKEVAERHEEKLLMLGPVLTRLDNELLSPVIDITFDRMARAGMLTGALQPPPELEGMELKIEYVSVLAQAQRAVNVGGVDRLLGTVGSLAQAYPQVLDKIDADQVVDDLAEMYGVNPEIIVPDERVAEIRAQRAQQQAAQQMLATAPVAAEAARTASEIDADNLREVLEGVQGGGGMPA